MPASGSLKKCSGCKIKVFNEQTFYYSNKMLNTSLLLPMRALEIKKITDSYAEGAVWISSGKTRVLCTVSVEEYVPSWLKGSGQGWLTAEYSLLPRSTHTRVKRERDKMSGRTAEIQRLISRCLRQAIDLKALGERTLIIDCDVIQADGGTRVACINGACVALALALNVLVQKNSCPSTVWRGFVAAMSVGFKNTDILLDLCYEQDSTADVDANIVWFEDKSLIEVQATGEHSTFSQAQLEHMLQVSLQATQQIVQHQKAVCAQESIWRL